MLRVDFDLVVVELLPVVREVRCCGYNARVDWHSCIGAGSSGGIMVKKRSVTASGKSSNKEHRASWKGELQIGLVSFPVEAFNALRREAGTVHFHQLHRQCHSRIHYDKVCPVHGKVTQDQIVMGYEYEKDHYVEISTDQLDALRTHEERTLTIDAFVRPDVIDPVYFDGRMYYILPANKTAEKAYSVIVEAIEREECYGIGQVVFSGRQQLALIRPMKQTLQMAMLNYAAEIKLPADITSGIKKWKDWDKQLKLAQTLIRDQLTDDFDFSQYEDTYSEKVEKLIASKVKGKKIVVAKEEKAPATISLMEALKKSVEHATSSRKRPTKGTHGRHTA